MSVRYALRPTKHFFISETNRVLCTVKPEAKEISEHRVYNKTHHNILFAAIIKNRLRTDATKVFVNNTAFRKSKHVCL